MLRFLLTLSRLLEGLVSIGWLAIAIGIVLVLYLNDPKPPVREKPYEFHSLPTSLRSSGTDEDWQKKSKRPVDPLDLPNYTRQK